MARPVRAPAVRATGGPGCPAVRQRTNPLGLGRRAGGGDDGHERHFLPALRRAARLGDGWISAGSSLEELKSMIGQIEEFRVEYGRTDGAFEYHAMTEAAYSKEGLDDLAAAGVTEVFPEARSPTRVTAHSCSSCSCRKRPGASATG